MTEDRNIHLAFYRNVDGRTVAHECAFMGMVITQEPLLQLKDMYGMSVADAMKVAAAVQQGKPLPVDQIHVVVPE